MVHKPREPKPSIWKIIPTCCHKNKGEVEYITGIKTTMTGDLGVECKAILPTQVVTLHVLIYTQDLKNIKNVKGCRDGMPKSIQTR